MSEIPPEIVSHYERGDEARRLFSGGGELERLRTLDILARELPKPPAVICDVGGAAGAYAFELARQGYAVHLIDPVDIHLEQARAHEKQANTALASISQGDARRLDVADASADAVLLLGPLYHLIDRADRLCALREARRVLKPSGVLFAAGISRFASLFDGLVTGAFADPDFRGIVADDLRTGMHHNPTDNPDYFTTACFHRPEELSVEVSEAGFTDARVLAVEGAAGITSRFQQAWDDPEQREALLQFMSQVEAEPSLLGASGHLLAVARRPVDVG